MSQPTLAAQAERNPEVFDCGYYATQLQVARSLQVRAAWLASQ